MSSKYFKTDLHAPTSNMIFAPGGARAEDGNRFNDFDRLMTRSEKIDGPIDLYVAGTHTGGVVEIPSGVYDWRKFRLGRMPYTNTFRVSLHADGVKLNLFRRGLIDTTSNVELLNNAATPAMDDVAEGEFAGFNHGDLWSLVSAAGAAPLIATPNANSTFVVAMAKLCWIGSEFRPFSGGVEDAPCLDANHASSTIILAPQEAAGMMKNAIRGAGTFVENRTGNPQTGQPFPTFITGSWTTEQPLLDSDGGSYFVDQGTLATSGGSVAKTDGQKCDFGKINKIAGDGSNSVELRRSARNLGFPSTVKNTGGGAVTVDAELLANEAAPAGDSLAFANPIVTLSLSGLGAVAGWVGKTIRVADPENAANDGDFVLTAASGDDVSWSNASGVADASFTGSFKIYNETITLADGTTAPSVDVSSETVQRFEADGSGSNETV